MTVADVEAVVAVEARAQGSPWPASIFARELDSDWSHPEVVVSDKGDVIGFMVYWSVADEVHLLNVVVDAPWRRRGIGRALVTRLVELSRAAAMRYVTLEVRVSNAPAQQLYRALGFERAGLRRRYYADNGEDALVMARRFDAPDAL